MANRSGSPFPEDETAMLAERPSDELVLQHLGAAAMLCWARLPLGAREQILSQAGDMIGLAPASRQDIIKLLLRHAKAEWTAAVAIVRKP